MISALRDLALTSIQLVEQRLRLLGAELQEEKWRAVEAILWLALALGLGALALLVASLAVAKRTTVIMLVIVLQKPF